MPYASPARATRNTRFVVLTTVRSEGGRTSQAGPVAVPDLDVAARIRTSLRGPSSLRSSGRHRGQVRIAATPHAKQELSPLRGSHDTLRASRERRCRRGFDFGFRISDFHPHRYLLISRRFALQKPAWHPERNEGSASELLDRFLSSRRGLCRELQCRLRKRSGIRLQIPRCARDDNLQAHGSPLGRA